MSIWKRFDMFETECTLASLSLTINKLRSAVEYKIKKKLYLSYL